METIENVILRNLIFNDEYTRKVLPYIKENYFNEKEQKILFTTVTDYVLKYNNLPTIEALDIIIGQKSLHPDTQKTIFNLLKQYKENSEEKQDEQWLIDSSEEFCKNQAIYNAVLESINILDKKGDSKIERGAIPQLLTEALGVSFDTNIGHDYFEDAEQRYEWYHRKEHKIPFDLEYLNKITKGGVVPKTLNLLMAPPNAGKSLVLCHFAASYLAQGYDVLYITLEMSEEAISQRIDANLHDMNLDDVVDLPKEIFLKRIAKIRSRTTGKLIVKEFPTASASTIQFRQLINDLNLKKGFKPKVMIIDYLNICSSARIGANGRTNLYLYNKSIAEEIRGLAVDMNLPIWTATQINRSGASSSDPEMEDTSESWGLPSTVDLQLAIVTNDELEQLNQFMFKQIKNRYNDKTKIKRFVVGVDRPKMKLRDCINQGYIADSGQEHENNVDDVVEVRSDKRSKFRALRVE